MATNTKGIDAKSAKVVVRRQTQIKQAPADLTVTAGTQAKFVCTALTDPDESQVSILFSSIVLVDVTQQYVTEYQHSNRPLLPHFVAEDTGGMT